MSLRFFVPLAGIQAGSDQMASVQRSISCVPLNNFEKNRGFLHVEEKPAGSHFLPGHKPVEVLFFEVPKSENDNLIFGLQSILECQCRK